jgi:hypothetical protein
VGQLQQLTSKLSGSVKKRRIGKFLGSRTAQLLIDERELPWIMSHALDDWYEAEAPGLGQRFRAEIETVGNLAAWLQRIREERLSGC